MPTLRDLNFSLTYESLDPGFIRFYSECFQHSVEYYRGVGFFSSTAWEVLYDDVLAFAQRGGTLHYIASPILSEDDAGLLRALSASPDAVDDGIAKTRAHQLVSELLRRGAFRIRFAFPVAPLGPGLYHEKIAVFRDERGDFVAFSGSLNETATALVRNYERIEVFRSWDPRDQLRALALHAHFHALWNSIPGVAVQSLTEAAAQLRPRPPEKTHWDPDQLEDAPPTVAVAPVVEMGETSQQQIRVPDGLHLREHQTAAIADWLKNGMHGILRMATGSGKTITALTAATLLAQRSTGLLIMVVCPYTHLVDQWEHEARQFGFDPITCYGARRAWQKRLTRHLGLLDRAAEKVMMVITTQATFAEDVLSSLATIAKVKRLIIADEVHGMGAPGQLEVLKTWPKFEFRLGLSATPERWFDPVGTAELVSYFGAVLTDYSLERALHDRVLVPYSYYPELIELEEEEHVQYAAITRKIGQLLSEGALNADDMRAKVLLLARARLVAGARNKLPHLKGLLIEQQRAHRAVTHTLVYCGDGRVESDATEPVDDARYIEAAADLLSFDLGISCAVYVAETKLERRLQLQRELSTGKVGAIVAIRCLDEGVDIPAARFAYILASSRNPRQFIQRRGRLLRRDDASGKDNADIFDFVVVPPKTGDELSWRADRAMLRSELRRIVEFSRLSRNEGVALRRLRPLREEYDLLGFQGEEGNELINF